MTIILYGGPQTRASMPRWYMEEMGIPYELVEVSMANGENLKDDFLSVNPFAKLPAMKDNSVLDANNHPLTLFESGAILLHLAEHHGGEILRPGDRSLISQWTHFANSTLAFAIFVPDQKTKILPRILTELNSEIATGYFINNKWGAADCAISSYLAYIKLFFPNEDLSAYPVVEKLIQTTRERPAYKKVMGLS
jgi:glutathione S-transferase